MYLAKEKKTTAFFKAVHYYLKQAKPLILQQNVNMLCIHDLARKSDITLASILSIVRHVQVNASAR